MVRFQVHSYQLPRWIVLVLALAALALIPFALVLALGLGVLAIGASAFRVFLAPAGPVNHSRFEKTASSKLGSSSANVIDADYEIKGENEKSKQR